MSLPVYSWASYAPVQVSAADGQQPPITHVSYAHSSQPQPLVGKGFTSSPPPKHMPTPSTGPSGTAVIEHTDYISVRKSHKKTKLRSSEAKTVEETLFGEIYALHKRLEEVYRELSQLNQTYVHLMYLTHTETTELCRSILARLAEVE